MNKLKNSFLVFTTLLIFSVDVQSTGKIDTENNLILNESSVSNCFNKELEDKISHIDDQFNVKNLFLKNFKSNMIKLIKENKLSKEEINT
ncbi:TPA: hypothetical protein RJX26_003144, partial [Legionella pneumophila]|nr:hypothetical protein [Legionella pneumophila]